MLSELFEVFIRVCNVKLKENKNMSEIMSNHLMVAIYAYFHRYYENISFIELKIIFL